MITDPRVSACIVLYNTPSTVLETVKCIVNSDERIQLYVVDNTTEPTHRRIRNFLHPKNLISYEQKGTGTVEEFTAAQWSMKLLIDTIEPTALYFPQKRNLGFGRGNNAVLPHLKSVYHLLINPDITFDHTLVSRMVDYMDAHPDIAILTPRVFFPNGEEQFLPKHRPTVRYLLGGPLEKRGKIFQKWRDEYTMKNEEITEPLDVQFATGCFLLIRTHVFYKMKGFDPRYFLYQEDSDLSLKALQYGHVVYHPDMHVTHAWTRADAHSFRLRLAHLHSTAQFFWKWGWKW